MEGDSNLFEHKLDSLLNLDLDAVPDEEFMEARIGQGTAKLISMEPKQRDDLIRSTTPFALLFLIPEFGILLRLFNLGKKSYYVDYVVFISHMLSMGLIASMILTPVSLGFD